MDELKDYLLANAIYIDGRNRRGSVAVADAAKATGYSIPAARLAIRLLEYHGHLAEIEIEKTPTGVVRYRVAA